MTNQTTPFELTVKENHANHSLNVIVLQKRIAELEAALTKIADKTKHAHIMSHEADIWRLANMALKGETDA